MNAEETRIYKSYKIKNIHKTNRALDSISDISKAKRFMKDINAQFEHKITAGKDNIFFDSLKSMTVSDITLNEAAKKEKKQSVDFLRYFILVIALGVFLYTGYEIVGKLYDYVQAAQEYSDIQGMFDFEKAFLGSQSLRKTKANTPIKDLMVLQRQTRSQAVAAEAYVEGKREDDLKRMNIVKFEDINPDFYGWIRVSHTLINYPVVQRSTDPTSSSYDPPNYDHYLYYSFKGTKSPSGAIFVDKNNYRDVSKNFNTVVYGHNMLDRSMFQPLIDYGTRIDYFRDGIIELITKDAIYYYEVFSVREENPTSGYIEIDFSLRDETTGYIVYEQDEEGNYLFDEEGNAIVAFDEEKYLEFLYTMQSRSYFKKNIVFTKDSRIITLSTCVNDVRRDMRFVVQGVLVEIR